MSSAMAVDNQGVVSLKAGRRRGRQSVKTRGRKLNRRQKGEVKRLIAVRQELKFFNITANYFVMTAAGAVIDISQVGQGDTDQSRDGDRLMWCGTMELRYNIINGQTATADSQTNNRVIVFQWHPASTPTVSGAGTGVLLFGFGGAAADVGSAYSHDNRQMYTILYDSNNYLVGNQQAAITANITPATGVQFVKIPLSRAAKQVQFANGSASVRTNGIYMLLISDTLAGTTNRPTIAYSSKIFFRDS